MPGFPKVIRPLSAFPLGFLSIRTHRQGHRELGIAEHVYLQSVAQPDHNEPALFLISVICHNITILPVSPRQRSKRVLRATHRLLERSSHTPSETP
jgi:hypothetical protein